MDEAYLQQIMTTSFQILTYGYMLFGYFN